MAGFLAGPAFGTSIQNVNSMPNCTFTNRASAAAEASGPR